jgi:hypothetical protein
MLADFSCNLIRCYNIEFSHAVSAIRPMVLSRRVAPFDHPDWLFELKHDGF